MREEIYNWTKAMNILMAHNPPSMTQANQVLPDNEDYKIEARKKILLWNGTYKIAEDTFSGNVYERHDPNLNHKSL